MTNYKQDENGGIGEERSRSYLRDCKFWIHEVSVDADGRDLLVTNRFKNDVEAMEMRRKPMRFAAVQSKFFEGKNQVNVSKKYIHDTDNSVRQGFLIFVHTDVDDKPVHYLFTAEEVARSWNSTADNEDYYFSLRDGRIYDRFRNLERSAIREKVEKAIAAGTNRTMDWVWTSLSNTYGSFRVPHCRYPEYQLMKVKDAAIAIFHGGAAQLSHPIEPRKDIYRSLGTFDWGYSGEGPRLLAASILTHFLCGQTPTKSEINKLVDNLISRIPNDQSATFGKNEIFKALAGVRYDVDLSALPPLKEKVDFIEAQFAQFFR